MFVTRPATVDDWPFIRATAKPTIANAMRAGVRATWEQVGNAALDAMRDNLDFTVACADGDPTTLLSWIARAPDGVVMMTYVSHRFRGNGVGRRLREKAR